MGWLKRLFSKRPVDVPKAEESATEEKVEKADKAKKVIDLEAAKKLDGWEIYKAKNLVDEELLVEARLFTEDDPEVDLVTAKATAGTYISICDLGASVFHKATFEETYEKV